MCILDEPIAIQCAHALYPTDNSVIARDLCYSPLVDQRWQLKYYKISLSYKKGLMLKYLKGMIFRR